MHFHCCFVQLDLCLSAPICLSLVFPQVLLSASVAMCCLFFCRCALLSLLMLPFIVAYKYSFIVVLCSSLSFCSHLNLSCLSLSLLRCCSLNVLLSQRSSSAFWIDKAEIIMAMPPFLDHTHLEIGNVLLSLVL